MLVPELRKNQVANLNRNSTYSGTKEKIAKVQEFSVEKVKDSPQRLQPKGAPSEIVESIIEPPVTQ
jgi:hypothetical protein